MKNKFFLLIALFFGVLGLVSCDKGHVTGGNEIENSDFSVAMEQLAIDYPKYDTKDAKWVIDKQYQVATFTALVKSNASEISVWYDVNGEDAQRKFDVVDEGTEIPAVIKTAFNATVYSDAKLWKIKDVELGNRYNNDLVVSIYEVELDNISDEKLEAELYFDAITGKLLLSKEELESEDNDRYIVDAALQSAVSAVYPDAIIIAASNDDVNIEVDVVATEDGNALELEMLFTLDKVYVSSEYEVQFSELPIKFSAINTWFENSNSYTTPADDHDVEVLTGANIVVNDIKCSTYITMEYNLYSSSEESVEISFYLDADNNITKFDNGLVLGKYSQGTFILNEGNMSSAFGSLIFIGADGVAVDNAFVKENPGRSLPWLTQDMCMVDGRLYVIGQGCTMLVIDASTLKLVKEYSPSQLGIASNQFSTHISVIGKSVFIRHGGNSGSDSFISKFDLDSEKLTTIDNTKGASKNRMVVIDNILYSSYGDELLIIKEDATAAEIVKTPNGGQFITLRASDDGNLWLSSQFKDLDFSIGWIEVNQIMKMNVTTREFDVNKVSYSLNSGVLGASPVITALGETLYFQFNDSDAKTRDIIKHVFTDKNPETNTTVILKDINQYTPNYKYGLLYNEISINPVTKKMYINMLSGYGVSASTNDIMIFDVESDKLVFDKSYSNILQFPSAILFTPEINN